MIQDIRLSHGVRLIAGQNIVNASTYIMLKFIGGHSVQRYLELGHLCEHVVSGFDYMVGGVRSDNMYMGSKKADARIESDCMMFSFCVNSPEDLDEKLDTLTHCINDVIIDDDELEKEKITIIDELIQGRSSSEYIDKVERDFKKITVADIRDYIDTNLTSDNLLIYTIGNIDIENMSKILDSFVCRLRHTGRKNTPNLDFKGEWYGDKAYGEEPSVVNISLLPSGKLANKKDRYLFDLLLLYLGNFRMGIKRSLRHEKRLCYRTAVSTSGLDQADIQTQIVCKDDNVEQVLCESEQYFDTLFSNGVSEAEFELVKDNKHDYLLARPLHIPIRELRKIGDEYISTADPQIDEKIERDLLANNREAVESHDQKQIDEMIKYVATLKYTDFNAFMKKYFLSATCLTQIESGQGKLVQ